MSIKKGHEDGAELAKRIFNELGINSVRLLPAAITPVYAFKNGVRTDQIVAQKLLVMFEGVAADEIKLPADFTISKADQRYKKIELVGLTATEFNNAYYFKAEDVEVIEE